MKRLAIALVASALSATAMADIEKPYVGIDYQQGEFELDNGATAKPAAVRLRAGSEVTPYIAVEAHAAFGVQDDDLNVPGASYQVNLNGLYAVYVRPQVKLGDAVTVYGLLGVAYADLEAELKQPVPGLQSQKGFDSRGSFGGGVDIKVTDSLRLNADYVDYIDGYTAVSAGLRFNLN